MPPTTLPPWAYNTTSLPPWIMGPNKGPMIPGPRVPTKLSPVFRSPTRGPNASDAVTPQAAENPIMNWFNQPNVSSYAPQPTYTPQPTNRPMDAPPIDNNYDSIMRELLDSTKRNETQSRTDYEGILNQLMSALNQSSPAYTPYNPVDQMYSQSPEMTEAFNKIRQLTETGGYGEGDLSNIRERGISPIRSIYANAMQDLDRRKVLQGDYSPGHASASTRMARDLSEQIAGKTTDVNAKIAEMVAAGKQAAIPQMLEATARENELKSGIQSKNVEARNRAEEFNRTMRAEREKLETGRKSDILGQIRSLYGTTPGMAESFSRNALGSAEMAAKLKQMRNAGLLDERKLDQDRFLGDREFGQRERESQRTGSFNERELQQRGGLSLIDAFIRAMQMGR